MNIGQTFEQLRTAITEFSKCSVAKLWHATILGVRVVWISGFFLIVYVHLWEGRNTIIIHPFAIAEPLESKGLNAEAFANHVREELQNIEHDLKSKEYIFVYSRDFQSQPSVEINVAPIAVKDPTKIARNLFRIFPVEIEGDVILNDAPTSTTPQPQATVEIYIFQETKDEVRLPAVITTSPYSLTLTARKTAEAIERQISPFAFAAYSIEHGNPDFAISTVQWMLIQPSHDADYYAHAYLIWGNALRGKHKYAESEEKFRAAATIKPGYAYAWVNWCAVAWEQYKYKEAIAYCNKAITLDSSNAFAYNNKGLALRDLANNSANYEEAERQFCKAIKLDPSDAAYHNNLGDVYREENLHTKALSEYQRAISMKVDFAMPYAEWGVLLIKEKKPGEAVAKLQKAIEIGPDEAYFHDHLGNAFRNLLDYRKAESEYKAAVKLNASDADVYYDWAVMLSRQGMARKAQEKLNKANQIWPVELRMTYESLRNAP